MKTYTITEQQRTDLDEALRRHTEPHGVGRGFCKIARIILHNLQPNTHEHAEWKAVGKGVCANCGHDKFVTEYTK